MQTKSATNSNQRVPKYPVRNELAESMLYFVSENIHPVPLYARDPIDNIEYRFSAIRPADAILRKIGMFAKGATLKKWEKIQLAVLSRNRQLHTLSSNEWALLTKSENYFFKNFFMMLRTACKYNYSLDVKISNFKTNPFYYYNTQRDAFLKSINNGI